MYEASSRLIEAINTQSSSFNDISLTLLSKLFFKNIKALKKDGKKRVDKTITTYTYNNTKNIYASKQGSEKESR